MNLLAWYTHSEKLWALVYRFTMSNKVTFLCLFCTDFWWRANLSFRVVWNSQFGNPNLLLWVAWSSQHEDWIFVPYELISDEELDYFYELAEITAWTCLMFTLCTLDFLAFMQRCLMKKGNPYKLPDIHTLDIMNCLFMQLEMCLSFVFLGGGGFFFGILFCT